MIQFRTLGNTGLVSYIRPILEQTDQISEYPSSVMEDG